MSLSYFVSHSRAFLEGSRVQIRKSINVQSWVCIHMPSALLAKNCAAQETRQAGSLGTQTQHGPCPQRVCSGLWESAAALGIALVIVFTSSVYPEDSFINSWRISHMSRWDVLDHIQQLSLLTPPRSTCFTQLQVFNFSVG